MSLAAPTTAHKDAFPFLSPALSPSPHPEMDDFGETWRLAAEIGVRCDLGEPITRIRDCTRNMVAMTTGCSFELRQWVCCHCHDKT